MTMVSCDVTFVLTVYQYYEFLDVAMETEDIERITEVNHETCFIEYYVYSRLYSAILISRLSRSSSRCSFLLKEITFFIIHTNSL